VAAWVLVIVGPTLVTLAALPFRVSLGLGGVLFCMLLVVIAVAVIGGAWPALAEVVLGIPAGAFFFARPYETLSAFTCSPTLSRWPCSRSSGLLPRA